MAKGCNELVRTLIDLAQEAHVMVLNFLMDELSVTKTWCCRGNHNVFVSNIIKIFNLNVYPCL